jgi:hypothetical protein
LRLIWLKVHIHLDVSLAIFSFGFGKLRNQNGSSTMAQDRVIIPEKIYQEQELTVKENYQQLLISRGKFYNYLRYRGVKISSKQ